MEPQEVVSSPTAVFSAVREILQACEVARAALDKAADVVPPYGDREKWVGAVDMLTEGMDNLFAAAQLAMRVGGEQ